MSDFNIVFTGEEIEIGIHKINKNLYFHYKGSKLWYKISKQAEIDFMRYFLQSEV